MSKLQHRFNRPGFTLIEFIGAVAVLALLAGMLIPTFIRRVDQAARTRDGSDLDTMADALTRYVRENRVVPSDIPNAIKSYMVLPLDLITNTPRKTKRTFLVDPGLSVGGGLPYTQTTAGSGKPANARVLIASCLESNAPTGTFSNLWNTPDTDFVRIKRVNLEPLFYQLMLVNRDPTSPYPKFSTGTNSTYDVVPNGVGTNAYYIDGSVVGLYATNGAMITRHVLNSSISFVFEGGSWRGQLVGTNAATTSTNSSNESQAFASAAAAFFATNWNPGANLHGGQSANQSAALAAMYNFMSDYTLWGNLTPTNFFRFGTSGGQMNSFPIYELLSGAYGNVDKYTGTGNDGLLHQ